MPMGKLSIVEYQGKDAGEVLMNILNGYRQQDPHEIESDTEVRRVGFQPNPEPEPDEGEDDSDTGE